MTQLRIADVKEQLETFEKDINERFDKLVNELNGVIDEFKAYNDEGVKKGCNCDGDRITELQEQLNQMRSDMIGHVNLYNQHIIQQHNKKG